MHLVYYTICTTTPTYNVHFSHCFFCNASEFIVDPMDDTLEVNQTDVILTCMPALNMDQLINWEIYLRNGDFWTVTGADPERQRSR